MGSAGIRRRKRVRHLNKVSDQAVPGHRDLIPPTMWPADGSGFEPSNFSPAGSMQRQWLMFSAACTGRTRRVRLMAWFTIVVFGLPMVLAVLLQLFHVVL